MGVFTSRVRLITAVLLFVIALLLGVNEPSSVAAFQQNKINSEYYADGENIPLLVNFISLGAFSLPKSYYELPFCAPNGVKPKINSVEPILHDLTEMSLYKIQMRVNSKCTLLPECNFVENTQKMRNNWNLLDKAIEQGYRAHMMLNNLPAIGDANPLQFNYCPEFFKKRQNSLREGGYLLGLPIDCTSTKALLNNHLHFIIYYSEKPTNSHNGIEGLSKKEYKVDSFKIIPYSVKNNDENFCNENFLLSPGYIIPLTINDVKVKTVYWSYSVEWIKCDEVKATLPDSCTPSQHSFVSSTAHLTYMSSAMFFVLLLIIIVMFILRHSIHHDIVQYNLESEEKLEGSGWKLVYMDVFRPPAYAQLLSIMVGSGFKSILTVAVLMFLLATGIIYPSMSWSFLLNVIWTHTLMSFGGGFACGYMLQYLGCRKWKYVFVYCCGFPAFLVTLYIIISIFIKSEDFTPDISFRFVLYVFFLWLFVSLPLTLVGAFYAFRRKPLQNPVSVSRLPREIPPQPFLERHLFLYTMAPLAPFFIIAFELHFIMQAFWNGVEYHYSGICLFICLLWVIVIALMTVLHIYYILCNENHRWWWSAFMLPGCLGLPVFLYSVFFFLKYFTISSFPSFLYFLVMGIFSYSYGLIAGVIGLTASIIFARYMFGSIKID